MAVANDSIKVERKTMCDCVVELSLCLAEDDVEGLLFADPWTNWNATAFAFCEKSPSCYKGAINFFFCLGK